MLGNNKYIGAYAILVGDNIVDAFAPTEIGNLCVHSSVSFALLCEDTDYLSISNKRYRQSCQNIFLLYQSCSLFNKYLRLFLVQKVSFADNRTTLCEKWASMVECIAVILQPKSNDKNNEANRT